MTDAERKQMEDLRAELSELKDYINALLVLAQDFLPFCPDKARKMIEVAVEKGKALRYGGFVQLRKYRDTLQTIASGNLPGTSPEENLKALRDLAAAAFGGRDAIPPSDPSPQKELHPLQEVGYLIAILNRHFSEDMEIRTRLSCLVESADERLPESVRQEIKSLVLKGR